MDTAHSFRLYAQRAFPFTETGLVQRASAFRSAGPGARGHWDEAPQAGPRGSETREVGEEVQGTRLGGRPRSP